MRTSYFLMENMTETNETTSLLSLTSDITAAYVTNNRVKPTDLSSLIQQVYQTLSTVGSAVETAAEKPVPAVPIKKSVFPSYIVCLEDGKKLKMLKRHLATSYDMTPEQYRQRWGLTSDYPMVAPEYASRRSELAKSIGLGRKRAEPVEVELPAKRGRKKAIAA